MKICLAYREAEELVARKLGAEVTLEFVGADTVKVSKRIEKRVGPRFLSIPVSVKVPLKITVLGVEGSVLRLRHGGGLLFDTVLAGARRILGADNLDRYMKAEGDSGLLVKLDAFGQARAALEYLEIESISFDRTGILVSVRFKD